MKFLPWPAVSILSSSLIWARLKTVLEFFTCLCFDCAAAAGGFLSRSMGMCLATGT